MRWDDEPFVKLYIRDEPTWLALSLGARGLFYELMRHCDRAGAELVEDGCIIDSTDSDGLIVLRNFEEAQAARQSCRTRQAEKRRRDRDLAVGKKPEKPEKPEKAAPEPCKAKPEERAKPRQEPPPASDDADRPPLGVAIPSALDCQEFREAWSTWAQEKRRRKPLTVVQAERCLRWLARYGRGKAIDIVETAIRNGWATLVDPDERKRGSKGGDDDDGQRSVEIARRRMKQFEEESAARREGGGEATVGPRAVGELLSSLSGSGAS